jgi:hypothetical protein
MSEIEPLTHNEAVVRAFVAELRNPPPVSDPENIEVRVLLGVISNAADVIEECLRGISLRTQERDALRDEVAGMDHARDCKGGDYLPDRCNCAKALL